MQELVPAGMPLAQFALRWILMLPQVTCAIPGARRPDQAEANAPADLPPLDPEQICAVQDIYDTLRRSQIHPHW